MSVFYYILVETKNSNQNAINLYFMNTKKYVFACFVALAVFFIIFLIIFSFSFVSVFFLLFVAKREKYLCDKEICLFAMPFIYNLKNKRKEKQRSRRRNEKCLWSFHYVCVCVYLLFFFLVMSELSFVLIIVISATDVGRKSFTFIRSFCGEKHMFEKGKKDRRYRTRAWYNT